MCNPWKEKSLRQDQTVFEMAEEVLARQASPLADRTGQPLEKAMEIVADTEAGRQLKELANGEHRYEKARDWQASMIRERAEERLIHLIALETLSRFVAERPYSWLEGYLEWLESKEARALIPCAPGGGSRKPERGTDLPT
jgi:hypothetical protein